jgi:hypothetical protein
MDLGDGNALFAVFDGHGGIFYNNIGVYWLKLNRWLGCSFCWEAYGIGVAEFE